MLSIREVMTTEADQKSAQTFFQAVSEIFDLSEAKALDMFARTGELTVVNYKNAVKELHCWELMPDHEETLRVLHNPAEIRIGCAYNSALATDHEFDFIVIDSPQGAHSDHFGLVHFEHFDIVKDFLRPMVADECIVVLYVNKSPYDKNVVGSHGYDQYSEYNYNAWMVARQDFYGSAVVTEEEAIAAYRKAVGGWATIEQVLTVPCFSDVPDMPPYAFRIALKLSRK